MKPTNIVFNTVTALGADCKVTINGDVSMKGASFNKSSIVTKAFVPYVADTLQVTDVVVTATASTSYSFNLTYTDTLTNVVKVATWTGYTSAASTSRTAIATAAMNFINNIGNCSVTATLSGAAPNQDLVITSETYYPEHNFSATGSTGVMTPTVSTAGVVGNGSGAKLVHFNPSLADDGISTSNNYDQVIIGLANPAISTYVNGQVNQTVTVYVKTDATNVKTLVGYLSSKNIGFGTLTAVVFNSKLATIAAAVTGDAAVANGVITVAGTADIFYGNSDTNIGATANDIVTIAAVPYRIASILTATTAATDCTPNDASAAATLFVKFTQL